MFDLEAGPSVNGKLNCWEYMKCGRELGGGNAYEFGVCPAAVEVRLEGVHDGICGGRACWVIDWTQCGDAVQGTFAQKIKKCGTCDFYEKVKAEEGDDFIPTIKLIKVVA